MERYKLAISLGITHDEFMSMDIKYSISAFEGKLLLRENRVNDFKDLLHTIAAKIAAAVWGNKEFSKIIKPFRLRPETRAEKLADTANAMKMTENDIRAFIKRGGKNGRRK